MKGEIIPDAHHVSRLCGGSHIREDGTISATAFRLRPGESYLSVNWLEQLGLASRQAEVSEIWRVLATKRKIGASARLAVLNVGSAREIVTGLTDEPRRLSFRHEPEAPPDAADDPSHSGIHGIREDDNLVAELLARSVLESHAPQRMS